MKLMMYIENDLIEAVPLDQESIKIPGYLGNIKRSLKMKYNYMINLNSTPPDFLVVEPIIEPQKTKTSM